MDSGWTPGAGGRHKKASKDTLDDLLGDLLDDDAPPKKKSTTANRQQFSTKKQSSKDEDFYSSLAQAANDDELSDVSEADVNQMAKSIADLDDLDADLFPTGSATTAKTPKRGSLKDKSGKVTTPRRTGTPRSRGSTPRAASPPLRLTSPANRVISPTHQRLTSPPGRGTPTGRDISGSPAGIDSNRPGSGSKRSPTRKPQTPPTEPISEYRPTTAPGKMTDLGDRASVGLKPGQQEQERPRTVPKAKSIDFGEFDADDPLAGIPLSDEDEDLGLPAKRQPPKQQQQQQPAQQPQKEASPRAPAAVAEQKQESPRQRSLFDRPPTRSGSTKTDTPERELEPKQPQPAVQKPAPAKKKAEEALFSDDDDFLGGLGIEEKGVPAKPKPKAVIKEDDEDDRPARSAMDKLLGRDTAAKHLEQKKERREFVLDAKYTQPQDSKKDEADEDEFLFGSYMPSAVGSNSSRPTSRRSVRFQDDDDIFGLDDAPARARSPPGKKGSDDGLDWLEMATSAKTTKPAEKPAPKAAEPKPEPIKPSTAPAKPKGSAADWLELKDDDESEEFDFLKASSFSAPARQGMSQKEPEKPKVSQPTQPAVKKDQSQFETPLAQPVKDDYLGLGEEIDPNKLLRNKAESPVDGGPDIKSVLQEDDIFDTQSSLKTTTDKPDQSRQPLFESAARRNQMSPRMKSPRRSPERKPKDTSPRSLVSQLADIQNKPSEVQKDSAISQPTSQQQQQQKQQQQFLMQQQQQHQQQSVTQEQEPEDELNSSTDFFSFKKKQTVRDNKPLDQSAAQLNMQTSLQTDTQFTQSMTGAQFQPQVSLAGPQPVLPDQQFMPDMSIGSMQPSAQQLQQLQQQQQMQRQQQIRQQQQLMKQLQRQQQQFQKQQQQQMQQIQQMSTPTFTPDQQMFSVDRPLFMDDMSFGMGAHMDLDAQSKIRRLEVELQYARDILTSTKKRYEEEIAALEASYKNRVELMDETSSKREQRWREENENLVSQHLMKLRKLEEEKTQLTSTMYKKLEDGEMEKAQELERIKDIHRQALEALKKDHEESLNRLKRSKDQQIEVAAASHDTTRSLVATVELIQNNAKDLGVLQRKIDSWNAQGLDDREINLRAKDEQLKMLQERLNKQQEDNEAERHRLQELVARLETQIREQTRMLEEERWKVKQEQSRLQGLQTALEDERRSWADHQARERANMEKVRESLLEEQKTTLAQLHKERQSFADEQVTFNMKQKMAREEGSQSMIKSAQAKAELEALTRAVAEAKDKYEMLKEDIRKEEERIQEERRRIDKERAVMHKKEEELMQSAIMLQDRSKEVEDTYVEGQRKQDEGLAALAEAQRLEAEEGKRIDTINHQLNLLKMKEKELTDERLRLSKEKRELEKFRNGLLCPNCRRPSRQVPNGNINYQMNNSSPGLLMAADSYQGDTRQSNGYPVNGGMETDMMSPLIQAYNPAFQLSVNTVDAVTESIKADRSIRLWKMEAVKDQKYLEEQSLFLHSLKCMPYSSPKS